MRSLVEKASAFARKAHAQQVYGDGPFHENHLARVVGVLESLGETGEFEEMWKKLEDLLNLRT